MTAELRGLLAARSSQHSVPGAALGVLRNRAFVVDADDPDNLTVTLGAFDESGRPGVLYEMLWALPRESEGPARTARAPRCV